MSPIVVAFKKLSIVTSNPSSLSFTTTHTELIELPPNAKKFFFSTSVDFSTPIASQITLKTLLSIGSSFCLCNYINNTMFENSNCI